MENLLKNGKTIGLAIYKILEDKHPVTLQNEISIKDDVNKKFQ